jgi:hypothetical protein
MCTFHTRIDDSELPDTLNVRLQVYYIHSVPGQQQHVNPLLGNDRDISKKQEPLLSNAFANKHFPTETMNYKNEELFPARSVSRCYKRGKLRSAVCHSVKRRLGCWCEMAASLGFSQLKQ